MTNKPYSQDELLELSARAVVEARARKARVLDEAELEQAAGGVAVSVAKLQIPIIFGLIFPEEILNLKQSPLSLE